MKSFLLLLLFSLNVLGQQVPNTTAQQQTLQNILVNAGFENGKAGWVNSGGTFTVQTGTVIYGAQSAAFTASAGSQYLQSASTVIPRSMYGKECLAAINYTGGSSALNLTVVDGSDAVINASSVYPLNSDSGTKLAKLYFTCPTSGSIKLRIASTGSSAIAYIDDAIIGISDSIPTKKNQDNLVKYGDAENGTSGWTVDSFAAASRPAGSLTGTTTGITFSTSASSPLAGSNSFTFAKDAANRQGRVLYTGLTFTPAYFARVMNVSVDMILDSGTFTAGTSTTDSDLIWYIQNVTDGTFIEPSSFKILSNSTTNSFQFNGTFQTAASATSYRLLLYVASTSASAYTMKFDNVVVTPSTYAYGTPITDWQSYTGTIAGMGTVTGSEFRFRQVGDETEVAGTFTAGTTTASVFSISLPTGRTIDTNKVNSTNRTRLGFLSRGQNSTNNSYPSASAGPFAIIEDSVTSTSLVFASSNTNSTAIPYSIALGNSLGATGDVYDFTFSFPTSGKSSSVQTSDQTDTRVVAFSINKSVNQSLANASNVKIQFDSLQDDTHGAWSGASNYRYTIPVAGKYTLSGTLAYAASTVGTRSVSYTVNGGPYIYLAQVTAPADIAVIPFSAQTAFLKVGDYIEIYGYQSSGGALNVNNLSSLQISRVSGPNQIAASESVYARYTTATGQVIANNSIDILNFNIKDRDSHNAVTTGASWKFTAPISGMYRVSSGTMNAGTVSSGYISLMLYKNGTLYSSGPSDIAFSAGSQGNGMSDSVYLLQGEYIDVRFYNNATTSTRTLNASSTYNFVSIERVGN